MRRTVWEVFRQRVHIASNHLGVQRFDGERLNSKRQVASQHGEHVDASLQTNHQHNDQWRRLLIATSSQSHDTQQWPIANWTKFNTTLHLNGIEQRYFQHKKTRSQAVARIADRTAWQHLWTIWKPLCHFLLVGLWNQASICNGFRDIQRRM